MVNRDFSLNDTAKLNRQRAREREMAKTRAAVANGRFASDLYSQNESWGKGTPLEIQPKAPRGESEFSSERATLETVRTVRFAEGGAIAGATVEIGRGQVLRSHDIPQFIGYGRILNRERATNPRTSETAHRLVRAAMVAATERGANARERRRIRRIADQVPIPSSFRESRQDREDRLYREASAVQAARNARARTV